MKANELSKKDLMIGDWIRIKDNVEPDAYFMHEDMYPGQSVKVEEILSNGINPDWCGGEVNDCLPVDAIEPIPLTAEMLENNGIEYQWGMPWYQEVYDGSYEFRYMSYDTELEVKIPVKFVHQLQHCLKLVGIDKDIVL